MRPWSARTLTLAAAVLTCVAAVPRWHDLDRLSLYSDEDLTVLSARSVLEGEGSRMPSGMPYRRALPFTWANAAVASRVGEDRETSYRATSALFGTLTPAALFLTGTALVSPSAALVASTMLALSEWHIAFSRFGRMYAPFLFFFILSSFYLWRWAWHGGWRNMIPALFLFAVTVSLHLLGLFALQFALIPPFLRKRVGVPPWLLIGVGLSIAGVAFYLHQLFVGTPYDRWSLPAGFALEGLSPASASGGAESDGNGMPWRAMLAALGGTIGAWLGWRLQRGQNVRAKPDPFTYGALLGGAAICGGLVGLGHLWGASLAFGVILLIGPHPFPEVLRRGALPLLFLVGGGAGWTLYAVSSLGLGQGLRRLLMFPFPYPVVLWNQFPGLMILFAAAVAWLLVRRDRDNSVGEVTAVLMVILSVAAVGIEQAWGGTRYLFQVYPYLLLVSSVALVAFGRKLARVFHLARAEVGAMVIAIIIAMSGLTGAHGLVPAMRAATLDHGEPINEYIHIFPFRPDHRGPGAFVRARLREGDVVITEHPATQLVYAGQADYWLRRPGDARRFMYLAPDGVARDIYADSQLLPTAKSIEDVIHSTSGRVWLITSGETREQRDWYFTEEQQSWLESIEASLDPRFTGADGVSRVFCFKCATAADD